MKQFPCIEDLREQARRNVPRMFFEYAEAGSYNQETLRANRADFEKLKLRQRILVNVDKRSTATTILGEPVSVPLALGPIGLGGMMHGDGEILACRAAQAMGIPYTLSTMSINSIEDVAAAVDKPFWFQLYVMRDRDFVKRLIGRAKAAKCSALVLTLDLPVLGQRHKDIKNGLTVPLKITAGNVLDILTRPAWCMRMLGTKRHSFGNLAGHVRNASNIVALAEWTSHQFDPTLDWKGVEWVKNEWGGKLILKGIQDVEDARTAVAIGADAIVVSNHGGRQLDGALSSIRSLPPIAAAVGDRIEVWMDGGIRSGQDLLKALALGAKGTLIGRAFNFGLGAMGEAGVTAALEIIRTELDTTMALCGLNTIGEIGRNAVLNPY